MLLLFNQYISIWAAENRTNDNNHNDDDKLQLVNGDSSIHQRSLLRYIELTQQQQQKTHTQL